MEVGLHEQGASEMELRSNEILAKLVDRGTRPVVLRGFLLVLRDGDRITGLRIYPDLDPSSYYEFEEDAMLASLAPSNQEADEVTVFLDPEAEVTRVQRESLKVPNLFSWRPSESPYVVGDNYEFLFALISGKYVPPNVVPPGVDPQEVGPPPISVRVPAWLIHLIMAISAWIGAGGKELKCEMVPSNMAGCCQAINRFIRAYKGWDGRNPMALYDDGKTVMAFCGGQG
jgi:hypothetical protein